MFLFTRFYLFRFFPKYLREKTENINLFVKNIGIWSKAKVSSCGVPKYNINDEEHAISRYSFNKDWLFVIYMLMRLEDMLKFLWMMLYEFSNKLIGVHLFGTWYRECLRCRNITRISRFPKHLVLVINLNERNLISFEIPLFLYFYLILFVWDTFFINFWRLEEIALHTSWFIGFMKTTRWRIVAGELFSEFIHFLFQLAKTSTIRDLRSFIYTVIK